ncbi:hypothetical protein P8452_70801 [Trifolium repens]|nr:hypothetical protein P8452_70801 [Trifolium repens]
MLPYLSDRSRRERNGNRESEKEHVKHKKSNRCYLQQSRQEEKNKAQHEKSGEQTLQNRYTIFSGAVVSFSGEAITGDYAPIFFFVGFVEENEHSLYMMTVF